MSLNDKKEKIKDKEEKPAKQCWKAQGDVIFYFRNSLKKLL